MLYRQLAVLTILAYAAMTTASAHGDLFTHPSSWATYDPGANGVGTDPDGYRGGAFDGRYIYFAPYQNAGHPARHGEVLRYDTDCGVAEAFTSTDCWATYDYGSDPNGCATQETRLGFPCTDPDGYAGAVFDERRYVYFAPLYNGTQLHGEVLRYDTTGDFNDPASWQAFDAMNDTVVQAKGGYHGVIVVGDYIYFVPSGDLNSPHGEVLRCDTQAPFGAAESWKTYEYANHCTDCNNPRRYYGAVLAGQYVYFAPYRNPSPHGEVLRYDTSGGFTDASSWEAYDAKANVGAVGGYSGAVFDGQYAYFVPYRTGASSFHGQVLRYDTTSDFDTASSWSVYDPGYNEGYYGAVLTGQYVYFSPFQEDNGDPHGEVLRYDTAGAFESPAAWAAYDYGDSQECSDDPNCTDPDGFCGVISDGRYVYFTPMHQDTGGGEVLRYDTANPIPTVSEWGLIVMSLLVLTAGTLVYARRRPVHT